MKNNNQEIVVNWERRTVFRYFLSVFVLIFGGYAFLGKSSQEWLQPVWIAAMFFFIVLPGCRVYFTPPLKISDKGVSIRYGKSETFFSWASIRDFKVNHVVPIRGSGRAYDYIEIQLIDTKAGFRRIPEIFRRLFGTPNNLIPANLEKFTPEIIEILGEFKSRAKG